MLKFEKIYFSLFCFCLLFVFIAANWIFQSQISNNSVGGRHTDVKQERGRNNNFLNFY